MALILDVVSPVALKSSFDKGAYSMKKFLTQEEAYDLLIKLRFVIQKSRSNLREMLGTDDLSTRVLKVTNPHLFDDERVGLLPMVIAMIEKYERVGYLDAIDMFNMLSYVHKDMAVVMCFTLIQDGNSLPEAKDVFKWGWKTS